jgi:hypothetical protein
MSEFTTLNITCNFRSEAVQLTSPNAAVHWLGAILSILKATVCTKFVGNFMMYIHMEIQVPVTISLLATAKGRAITQAVSRRLPTAAARVRSQVRSCGICGGQSGTGAGFLLVL